MIGKLMILFWVGSVGQACAEENLSIEELERLEITIFADGNNPDPLNLKSNLQAYIREFQGTERIKILKKRLFDLPGDNTRNKVLPARVRLIVVLAYENFLTRFAVRATPGEIQNARAMRQILYTELGRDFKPETLPSFGLLAVGDFLRKETEKPKQSRIYYDELLKRESGKSYHPQAWLGIAAVAALGDAKEKAIALQTWKKIRAESTQPKVIEEALAQSIFLQSSQANHQEVIELAKQYLKSKTFHRFSFEVRTCLANSYRDLDRVDDALTVYAQIWSGVNFRWTRTQNSIYEWMKLLWKRNKPGDRQLAYQRGFDFVKMTENAIKRAKPKTRAEWEKIAQLVKEYSESPDMQITEEKE